MAVLYVDRDGKQRSQHYDECPGCGEPKRVVSKLCSHCHGRKRAQARQAQRDESAEDLKLVVGACLDCGIRPAPEYDKPGMYIPVIVDNYCDDCRLRIRRRHQEDDGIPSRLRTHTPMGPIDRKPRLIFEKSTRRAAELTIYGSSGRDTY